MKNADQNPFQQTVSLLDYLNDMAGSRRVTTDGKKSRDCARCITRPTLRSTSIAESRSFIVTAATAEEDLLSYVAGWKAAN